MSEPLLLQHFLLATMAAPKSVTLTVVPLPDKKLIYNSTTVFVAPSSPLAQAEGRTFVEINGSIVCPVAAHESLKAGEIAISLLTRNAARIPALPEARSPVSSPPGSPKQSAGAASNARVTPPVSFFGSSSSASSNRSASPARKASTGNAAGAAPAAPAAAAAAVAAPAAVVTCQVRPWRVETDAPADLLIHKLRLELELIRPGKRLELDEADIATFIAKTFPGQVRAASLPANR